MYKAICHKVRYRVIEMSIVRLIWFFLSHNLKFPTPNVMQARNGPWFFFCAINVTRIVQECRLSLH